MSISGFARPPEGEDRVSEGSLDCRLSSITTITVVKCTAWQEHSPLIATINSALVELTSTAAQAHRNDT